MMERSVDVVVVGAGFAGMYMVHKCRQASLSVQVFEAGSDVGGTWYWNRYPGARCDVESVEYSYSFDDALQQEWEWTERYAGQPEILQYAQHVADRFDIRRDVQFNTKVVSAHFNETTNTWLTSTNTGDAVTSRFLVMATGCLSSANVPPFEGADTFAGEVYHTGEWPHDGVDFTGKKVGLIGTGSSAIQSIPLIAQEAQQLTVFQRTASYSVPARNDSIDAEYVQQIKADYQTFRDRNREQTSAFGSNTPKGTTSVLTASEEERHREFESRWQRGGFGFLSSYSDFLLHPDANEVVAEFVRSKIHEIVKDPATAEKLTPTQVIGCKRLCLDSGYYETFNRDNVSLVDVGATPIERLTPQGLITNDAQHTFDVLVYATGFDAMTGSILKVDIRGRKALPLAEAWEAGPLTYLGLCVAGFPNMFMISGPGSPSVLTNMIMSIEQHVEWIIECVTNMAHNDQNIIETTEESQQKWVAYVNAVAESTLYPSCNSWYLGANVPGKPRVFMPLIGFPAYVQKCREVVANKYEGFVLS
jgi:cation diffusion facilitator CzcD-associated flavoprotein CzcO